MEFKKYNSIENSYNAKFLNKVKEEGLAGGEFVVQEKIHGSNFSIYCNGREIKCGKRSGFLGEDENFGNYKSVLEPIRDHVEEMFDEAASKSIVLCGEIFGGLYPHDDVVKPPQATKIQKGVYYAPFNGFYCFDIIVDGYYLKISSMEKLCQMHNIFYAKPLFRGDLKDCLLYSNEFQTTIPALLDLPEIENNVCEGTVVKPEMPRFLSGGSRVIFKNKNATFQERKQERRKEKLNILDPLEGAALEAATELSRYVTENRLRNVLSKIGEVTQKDFGKISGLFNKDILEDFTKDYEAFEKLEKADRKRVTKEMTRESSSMIRENFVNIINGDF